MSGRVVLGSLRPGAAPSKVAATIGIAADVAADVAASDVVAIAAADTGGRSTILTGV